MLRKVPLVVILGSTGTGKTKLSIELAQRFGGEIISADSMQVYKGLDIATAKATKEEQAAAPHHLLDIAVPGQPFTVVNFRDAALPIIDDLLSKSKMPIIVGGTNYYIESLLWKILVTAKPEYSHVRWDHEGSPLKKMKCEDKIITTASSSMSSDHSSSDDDSDRNEKKNISQEKVTQELKHVELSDLLKMSAVQMANIDSVELHRHLMVVDSVTANRMHPNNKRKIIRALEVFAQSGKKLSEIYEEQKSEDGASNLGGPLRYPHIIMFWLQCDQEVLNTRLDNRVDGMVEMGLLPEIRKFYDEFIQLNHCLDYTKGVLQTIGFKEFIPYLEKYSKDEDQRIIEFLKTSNYNQNDFPDSLKLLNSCLDELKLVTRRYSKKQVKWIKNRFLVNLSRQIPPIYSLDTSQPQNWNELVKNPAETILNAYINHEPINFKPLEKIKDPRQEMSEDTSHYCEICERLFIGDFQYQLHIKGNKHKKVLASKRKKEKKNLTKNE